MRELKRLAGTLEKLLKSLEFLLLLLLDFLVSLELQELLISTLILEEAFLLHILSVELVDLRHVSLVKRSGSLGSIPLGAELEVNTISTSVVNETSNVEFLLALFLISRLLLRFSLSNPAGMSGSTISSADFSSVGIAASVTLMPDTLTTSQAWDARAHFEAFFLSLWSVDVSAGELDDTRVLIATTSSDAEALLLVESVLLVQ